MSKAALQIKIITMKKILLFTLISLIGVVASGQSIKRTSGNLDVLKSTKSIGVSFTYENMKVGKMDEKTYVQEKISDYNKKESGSGEEWHKKWLADRGERFEPKFVELLSKYLGEKGISANLGEGDILMKINVDLIEPGFNVGVARRNASVNFTCIITTPDGKEIASVIVKEASANSFTGYDFDVGYRVQESFAKGGRELAKFMIRDARL